MDKIIDYSLDNIGLIATLVILFIIFIVNTIISYKVYKSQHKYTKIFNTYSFFHCNYEFHHAKSLS